MDLFAELSDQVHAAFEARNKARDQALVQARALTRHAAQTIRAIHRSESGLAHEHLREARGLVDALKSDLAAFPDLFFAGYTQDAIKEYAEASITVALIENQPLPMPETLGIEYATYLNGLAEVTGELRRKTLDMLRQGYSPEAERLLACMDEIYALLITVPATGYPPARLAVQAMVLGGLLAAVLVAAAVARRRTGFGVGLAVSVLAAGLVTFGGAEFLRESLRKPYVITDYMFVNAVRLPAPGLADPFSITALRERGVLATAKFVAPVGGRGTDDVARRAADGAAVFRLLCATCHSLEGYHAIRPLVSGLTPQALDDIIGSLARAVDDSGAESSWTPPVRLETWRERRMPPFGGTVDERRALATYLALVGGADPSTLALEASGVDPGRAYFEGHCAPCHAESADTPFSRRTRRSAAEFYELIGRLPSVNAIMPTYDGDEITRRALAAHLEHLVGDAGEPGR